MTKVNTDEHDQIEAAFAANRLLSTFDGETRALVEPHATIVQLNVGDSVLRRGNHVDSSLFPFGPTMISLVVDLPEGRSIEVASIGQEGAVGGIVSCGHAPAFTRAEVQIGGPALKIPMSALEDGKRRSDFLGNLFCRYSDYLLAQVMQSVACNAFHSIHERAARWLLTTQDRAGDRLELTQEALAELLGAQRTTVNAVIRALQDEGLIASRRGVVQVVNRAGLKLRACPCYEIVEGHFTDVIGGSGSGAGAD